MPTAFVNAAAVVRGWLSAQTGLVGKGRPLTQGVHHRDLRSIAGGAYAVVEVTDAEATGPGPVGRYAVSMTVRGSTKEVAEQAATALANTLQVLEVGNVPMPGGVCVMRGPVTGPSEVDDADPPTCVVDADFYLGP